MKKLGFIFTFTTLFALGMSAQTDTPAKNKPTTKPAGTSQPASQSRGGNVTTTPSSTTATSSSSTSTTPQKPAKKGKKPSMSATAKPAPAATKKTESAPTSNPH